MPGDPIAEYEALKPHDYSFLRSMHIIWSKHIAPRMDLVYSKPLAPSEALRLVFIGICLLKIPENPGSGIGSISSLAIEDVSRDQWEGINYCVDGTEMDGEISFYCHSFTCEKVSLAIEPVDEY